MADIQGTPLVYQIGTRIFIEKTSEQVEVHGFALLGLP